MKLSADTADRLIIAIKSQSYEEISKLFDSIEPISPKEARKLTKKVYRHFHKNYPYDFHTNSKNSFIKNLSLLACKSEQMNRKNGLHFIYLDSIPLFKRRAAYHPSYKDKFLSTMGAMRLMKTSAFLLNCTEFNEEDLPADLIIGGVEILVGSLICILPFPGTTAFGGAVIADGLYRSLNGITQMDEQNRARLFSFDY